MWNKLWVFRHHVFTWKLIIWLKHPSKGFEKSRAILGLVLQLLLIKNTIQKLKERPKRLRSNKKRQICLCVWLLTLFIFAHVQCRSYFIVPLATITLRLSHRKKHRNYHVVLMRDDFKASTLSFNKGYVAQNHKNVFNDLFVCLLKIRALFWRAMNFWILFSTTSTIFHVTSPTPLKETQFWKEKTYGGVDFRTS